MTLDENDCVAFFDHDGNGTAQINELGLVAFDTIPGVLSTVEKVYDTHIKKMLKLIYGNNTYTVELLTKIQNLASEIKTVLTETLGTTEESHILEFIGTLDDILGINVEDETTVLDTIKADLRTDANIEVEDVYNADQTFLYSTDKYKEYADTAAYAVTDASITDEAQRIKLITYYTFNALPIQSDWEILIYYRIYAN